MPRKIDWSYHRPGCKTCSRAKEFLANHDQAPPKEELDARKDRLGKADAEKLLAGANRLFVARGKKVVDVNLRKPELEPAEILKMIMGPTGNLRAPTLRVGKTLVVGFNEEMFEQVFG